MALEQRGLRRTVKSKLVMTSHRISVSPKACKRKPDRKCPGKGIDDNAWFLNIGIGDEKGLRPCRPMHLLVRVP